MNDTALTKAYVSLRREHNDLHGVAGSNVEASGFTLLAILRNEMYFLPEFLSHYRSLGVQRFVFLDDHSNDGSFEFLAKQSDTVVVHSGGAYGDTVKIPPSVSVEITHPRLLYLWRAMLCDLFAREEWALQVDLDEFVHLPQGMTFQDLVVRLDAQNERFVWGVMLDVYPEDFATLSQHQLAHGLDISASWYFDGERHVRLRKHKRPKRIYPGSRARLYREYGLLHPYIDPGVGKLNMVKRLFRKYWLSRRAPRYNAIWKPVLIKWTGNSYFRSSHEINLPASRHLLLPIQHFRFCGALRQRVQRGLREKSFFGGSIDHHLLWQLMQIMEECNGSFLYSNSRKLASFSDFLETGNTLGL